MIFAAHAGGNSVLGVELERERKQLAENGSIALAVHQDADNPNTAAGRKEKERRNAADTMSTQLAVLMADPEYRAAYDSLQDTIDNSRRKLDEWNRRIEERRIEIELLLNDPDNPVPAAEREALEQEDLNLLRLQQDVADLNADVDDADATAKRGGYKDVDALNDVRDSIERRKDALEDRVEVDLSRTRSSDEPTAAAEIAADLTIPTIGR